MKAFITNTFQFWVLSAATFPPQKARSEVQPRTRFHTRRGWDGVDGGDLAIATPVYLPQSFGVENQRTIEIVKFVASH